MDIAKNREEYGLIKTDLSKQKIGDKKFYVIIYYYNLNNLDA